MGLPYIIKICTFMEAAAVTSQYEVLRDEIMARNKGGHSAFEGGWIRGQLHLECLVSTTSEECGFVD